jgi:hypothetical protein
VTNQFRSLLKAIPRFSVTIMFLKSNSAYQKQDQFGSTPFQKNFQNLSHLIVNNYFTIISSHNFPSSKLSLAPILRTFQNKVSSIVHPRSISSTFPRLFQSFFLFHSVSRQDKVSLVSFGSRYEKVSFGFTRLHPIQSSLGYICLHLPLIIALRLSARFPRRNL